MTSAGEIAFVGDVHGAIDTLRPALEIALERAKETVLLGDYVNRGPGSKAVLAHLVELQATHASLRALRGNHDMAFLHCLEGEPIGPLLAMGGAPTIRSYVKKPRGDVASQLRSAVPLEHVDFLRSLEPSFETDEVVATHEPIVTPLAGVASGRFRVAGHIVQRDGIPRVTAHEALIDTGCGSVDGAPLCCFFWPSRKWMLVDPSGLVGEGAS